MSVESKAVQFQADGKAYELPSQFHEICKWVEAGGSEDSLVSVLDFNHPIYEVMLFELKCYGFWAVDLNIVLLDKYACLNFGSQAEAEERHAELLSLIEDNEGGDMDEILSEESDLEWKPISELHSQLFTKSEEE